MAHFLWDTLSVPQRVLRAKKHGLAGKTGSKAYEDLTLDERNALTGLTYGLPLIKMEVNPMAKKLFGAAAKAHAKKMSGKGGKKKTASKSSGGGVMHKAYSYKNKAGKTIHVKAHVEHPKRK